MRAELVLFIAGLVALAGCSGPTQPAAAASVPSATVAASAEGLGDAGQIDGILVDDSNAPIAGAQVLLKELTLQATSDEGGHFAFQNVPAGRYTLFAARLGYDSVAKAVDVTAVETASITIILRPVPIAEPYVATQLRTVEILLGLSWSIGGDFNEGCIVPGITCQGAAVSSLQPVNGPNFVFVEDDPEVSPLATLIIEEDWVPNSAICAKTISIGLYNPESPSIADPSAENPHYWTNLPHETFQITPPIWMKIPRLEEGNPDSIDDPTRIERNDGENLEVAGNWTLRNFPPGRGLTNTAADFNCFTQQKMDIFWTAFFLDPAPEGFSARPDA